MITVLNKIDRVTDPEALAALDRKYPDALHASAYENIGLDELLKACSAHLADRVRRREYRIPQSRGDIMNLLHRDAKVLSTTYEGDEILVTAVVPAAIAGRIESFAAVSV